MRTERIYRWRVSEENSSEEKSRKEISAENIMANDRDSTHSRTPLLRTISSRREPTMTSSSCSDFFALFSKRSLAIVSGPLATILIIGFSKCWAEYDDTDENSKIAAVLGILIWMACWWILVPVPLAITAFLPLVLFPFFGVMDSDTVSAEYTNSIVVLLLGTFILALAIEKYNLHKRIALKILLLSGGEDMNPRYVILGFLSASTFVSMWMSDTVAAVMLLPMASGVLKNLSSKETFDGPSSPTVALESSSTSDDRERGASFNETTSEGLIGKSQKKSAGGFPEEMTRTAIDQFGKGLIIAVTYGTALGGMATLIGSGPNVVLPGFYRKKFPDEHQLDFLQWSYFAIPLLIPYVILTWLFLSWYFCTPLVTTIIEARMNRRIVEKDYEALGQISFPEHVILTEFLILIVLWVTRVFGSVPGWGMLFNNFPSDGTVAMLAAIMLFIIPNKDKEGEMILDWKSCKDLSWSVILLVGGGFALSKGIEVSGLARLIGVKLQFLQVVPYYFITPVTIIILSTITEFSSNVSVATLFLPILAEVAVAIDFHPLLLMVPGTFASNFSYNLPSATPPNAIAMSTGHVKVKDMMYPGLFMHLVGTVLMSIFIPTLGAYVFGLNVPLH